MWIEKLTVYQQAMALIPKCEDLCCQLSRQLFDEQRQLLRAARSIPALLAEGYAKRKSQKEFLRYVLMALGSADEVQTHLQMIQMSRFNKLDKPIYLTLIQKFCAVSKQLNCLTKTITTHI